MTEHPNINNIWLITREYGNLAGAGGVKDVAKQLAEALAHDGKEVSVVLPCYGFIDPRRHGFKPTEIIFEVDMAYVLRDRRESVNIWQSKQNPTIFLADSRRFREKMSVYTYTVEEEDKEPSHKYGGGHHDYFAMNILLQKTALALMIHLNQRPDIIHCHDGHTATLPAMIREQEGFRHYFKHTGCVVTIHNAGQGYHQEVSDLAFAQAITGLPHRVVINNLLDGAFDPLLAASSYALLNTVSENYARELRETYDDEGTGWLGHRLMGRGVRLQGITNGIEPGDFDPSQPQQLGLAAPFQPAEANKNGLAGKKQCKKDLIDALQSKRLTSVQQDGSLNYSEKSPLFTFIGRLTAQKGVDKMIEALKIFLPIDGDFQILILGSGEKWIEDALVKLTQDKKLAGRICVLRGYDTTLANQVYAAGDFFLVPSQYEPCGLTDFMAQLFGNLPIVHQVGGLVKVLDGKTGFAYKDHSAEALLGCMREAVALFRQSPKKLALMQKTAIKIIDANYTWEKVMRKYLDLYEDSLMLTQ